MAATIFLDHDREALDREHNDPAKVPDAQARLTWYARASEAARRALPCRPDVAYGAHPVEAADAARRERAR